MKVNIRKAMRGLWICLILGTVAGGMLSCSKEEIPQQQQEDIEVLSLINKMKVQMLYKKLDGDAGLRVDNSLSVYQVFPSNNAYCFIEKELETSEFSLITSDEEEYSYRVKTVTGNTYQYAFRSYQDTLNLKVYSYDENEQEHSLLFDEDYLNTNTEFNICNN